MMDIGIRKMRGAGYVVGGLYLYMTDGRRLLAYPVQGTYRIEDAARRHVPIDERTYAAGYAYACGYHD